MPNEKQISALSHYIRQGSKVIRGNGRWPLVTFLVNTINGSHNIPVQIDSKEISNIL
ncbi:16281_t:CDS:2 [Funneliformis caledonium]|uniref:16281_t:CDS:1 n=1 Tax=Funneliformis caledonium TaxID=1117310 RepID=A0A9N9EWZ3_9GLOM|nr:16281_t:CDS:2 [Funneliformis caledonium]